MPVATPNPALGVASKLAIGPTAPTTLPLDFGSETLGLRETFIDPQGLRGTRSHAASRVRPSMRLVTGDVNLVAPTAFEIASVLPYVTGSAGVVSGGGKNYPLQEALSTFFVDLLRGATLFRYTGCRVSQARFHATKGTALQCDLSILGIDETLPGGTFPALTLNTDQFFVFEDAVAGVIVNGTTIDCFEFDVTLNNAVQPRMVNSQTATVVYSTDRLVSVRLVVPWGDAETLYGLAVSGVAVSITLTNANTSISFTMPAVQFPRQSPDVRDRDELRNELVGAARWNAAPNDELVIFEDTTP